MVAMKNMRIELIFFFLVLASCLTGQITDSLVIGKRINSILPVICENQGDLHQGHGITKGLSKEDSLTHCRYVIIFETNDPEVYYQKEFNLYDNLIAEGPVTRERNKNKLFGKREYRFFKNGIWKEYDPKNKEIHFIQCSQGFCKSGGWNIQIWQKTEKIE